MHPVIKLDHESKQPILQFKLFNALNFKLRMYLIGAFLCFAFALQIWFLNVWASLPFLLMVILLAWLIGFDNKVDFHHLQLTAQWHTIPFDDLKKITELNKKQQAWDSNFWELSNYSGMIIFISLITLVTAIWFYISQYYLNIANILVVDSLLIILFQWSNGMRSYQKLPDVIQKINFLNTTTNMYYKKHSSNIHKLQAQLLLQSTDEQSLPKDVKADISYPAAHKNFHGIQTQVVINRIQGTPYPYCYSVIVADSKLEFFQFLEHHAYLIKPKQAIIFEKKVQNNTEILVIRQQTTKTSGYHTTPEKATLIMQSAITIADKFVS